MKSSTHLWLWIVQCAEWKGELLHLLPKLKEKTTEFYASSKTSQITTEYSYALGKHSAEQLRLLPSAFHVTACHLPFSPYPILWKGILWA